MIETLVTFLGGTAFRLVFGSVMDFLSKKQDHQNEVEMQRLQAELESARSASEMAKIKLQADLGIKEITIRSDAKEREAMGDAFIEAVKAAGTRTGIGWVDAWNGIIRPAGASVSLAIWVGTMVAAGLLLSDFDKAMIAAFLGVFVGDRIYTKGRL